MSVLPLVKLHSDCSLDFVQPRLKSCSVCEDQFAAALKALGHTCLGFNGTTFKPKFVCLFCIEKIKLYLQYQKNYVILCELFHAETQAILEETGLRLPAVHRFFRAHICSSDLPYKDHGPLMLNCSFCIQAWRSLVLFERSQPTLDHDLLTDDCPSCSHTRAYWCDYSSCTQNLSELYWKEYKRELVLLPTRLTRGIVKPSFFLPPPDLRKATQLKTFLDEDHLSFLTGLPGYRSTGHPNSLASKPIRTIAIEGSIGVGKSTFIDIIKSLDTEGKYEFLPEPVKQWTNLGGVNMLQKFYDDPQEHAFTFQTWVLITRANQVAETPKKAIRIIERSFDSSLHCFANILKENGFLSDVQMDLLRELAWTLKSNASGRLEVDAYVYLKGDPATCLDRIRSRNRPEEGLIDIAYLTSLNKAYDTFMLKAKQGYYNEVPVHIIEGDLELLPFRQYCENWFRDVLTPMVFSEVVPTTFYPNL